MKYQAPKPPVILLAGPTCVGKTGVSVLLAKKLRTEIIGADSMQIYRHMDIGTEKPTKKQMGGVPHHMIDIVEPSETFSAGRFLEEAAPIVEGIINRGGPPIITGGTGLYIKAMTRGLFRAPSADAGLRERLGRLDTEALNKKLRVLDTETAEGIAPGDRRRLIRALEVCTLSGRKMSELKRRGTAPLPYDFLKIGLTRDRAELYPLIERRVDEMMKRGLLAEVKRVLGMNPSRTPLQAIGYKELKAYLEGEFDLEEAVRLIKRNTKRYAKRQITWFRKEEGLRWVDITGTRTPLEALELVMPVLPKGVL